MSPPGSHPRLVDDPGHGTNCGWNDRRHKIKQIPVFYLCYMGGILLHICISMYVSHTCVTQLPTLRIV